MLRAIDKRCSFPLLRNFLHLLSMSSWDTSDHLVKMWLIQEICLTSKEYVSQWKRKATVAIRIALDANKSIFLALQQLRKEIRTDSIEILACCIRETASATKSNNALGWIECIGHLWTSSHCGTHSIVSISKLIALF